MVKLKGIERIGSVFSCLAYVENCQEPIRLVYNTETEETEPFAFPKGYEYCTSHIAHAKRNLKAMAKLDTVPDQKTIMWY